MRDRLVGSRRENDQLPDALTRLIGGMVIMRLYGAIEKVEPQDDGTVRVHGIASSEVVDDQGEIVRADAMRAAIPDYMHFPALREMHQLSAAGTTLEAEVGDDGATRIVAHVVDPIAITKVRNQVYRGFSIGGRVTQREAGNPPFPMRLAAERRRVRRRRYHQRPRESRSTLRFRSGLVGWRTIIIVAKATPSNVSKGGRWA